MLKHTIFVPILLLAGCMSPNTDDILKSVQLPDASLFDRVDCNKDGGLSYLEVQNKVSFRVYGEDERFPEPDSHPVYLGAFDAADKNDDEKLDRMEFVGLFYTQKATGYKEKESSDSPCPSEPGN